jgi:hypothetical protein
MEHLEIILDFLNNIGIKCQKVALSDESTFLGGIKIDNGTLLYDIEKLKHVGDLLHEAGHIALELPSKRNQLNDNVDEGKLPTESLELGVILWSYAALKRLKLPPEVVFHSEGYKNESDFLIQNFENSNYIGLPLLQWMGLTALPNAIKNNEIEPFPNMIKWLREEPVFAE